MILTESRNHRTWRSQPNQSIYLRRGPDEYFDCQLPAEARTELEEIPRPQVYRVREIPTYRPAPPPPPVSAPRPPVTPGAARPAQRASPGMWLLLGFLVLIALLPHAISTLRTSSRRPVDDMQPQSRSVEVRRALDETSSALNTARCLNGLFRFSAKGGTFSGSMEFAPRDVGRMANRQEALPKRTGILLTSDTQGNRARTNQALSIRLCA
jgi:hypothetical protein